jgi:hypothetical protein
VHHTIDDLTQDREAIKKADGEEVCARLTVIVSGKAQHRGYGLESDHVHTESIAHL